MSNETGARLLQTMLQDALVAVRAIYGEEGLQKVAEHMKMADRARESNAEIDRLEQILAGVRDQ